MVPAKTILVVDDEQMIREVVASYLERKGFGVLAAESGTDALSRFEREKLCERRSF